MSRLVLSQVTIKKERSISSTKWYYLLQPANAIAPDSSNYGNPPPTYSETGYSGWSITEPTYTIGDNRKLYQMSLVVYTDGSYEYSTPTLSSSYEASKAAYNEIIQAETDIEELQDLGLHHGYIWTNSTYHAATGTIPEYPVGSYIASGINNTITQKNSNTYGLNTWVSTGGIKLRYNAINLAEFNTSNLNFYYPSTSSQQNKAVSLGTNGAKNSLVFYDFNGHAGMELDTSALTFYNPTTQSAQLVIGANGTLQSGNYSRGNNSKFSTDGTKIDLINGDIITKYFRVSQGLESGLTAGAYVHGTIEATQGKIGADSEYYWEIGEYTDYKNKTNATIIGHGGSFIQLGESNNWRLSTNRIHSSWHASGDTVLHYPQDSNNKYWDYGIHIPNSDNPAGRGSDKFLYIRTQNATNNSLENLLYDLDDNYDTPQWEYKFWIDGEGKVHAPGFYIGNSTIPIGGGAGTTAQKIINSDNTYGKGSDSKPIYIDGSGYVQEIGYTIQTSVPSGAIFTDHITSATTSGTGNAVTSITSDADGNLTVKKDITFLTSFTETDPTVPAWAKATTKPSYSYSEITGTVPQSALPSYVDDVIEYNSKSSFPATGETGKIYVDTSTNLTWRWSGTTYVEISPSLALGETSSTAYRGDRGKVAYAHAAAKGSAFASGLYKITTNAEGHVTAAVIANQSDIGLGNVLNIKQVTAIGSTDDGKLRVYKGTDYDDVEVQIIAKEAITADSADKLTSYGGAKNQPVYFPSSGANQGKPVGITDDNNNAITINKSVPSDAIFGYTFSEGTTNGTFNVTPKEGSAQAVLIHGLKALAYKDSLSKSDVGLGNVDNTADANKNVLTATKFSSSRTISLSGDTTGSQSGDGSGGWAITTKTDRLSTVGDKRAEATTPNSYANKIIFQGLKNKTTIGSPSNDTYSYLIGLRGWSDSSGGNSHELAFNDSGIYHRQGATTSWNAWKKLATTSDIPSVSNFLTYNVNEGVSAKKIFAQGTSYGTVSSKTSFVEKANINYDSTLDAIVFSFN